MKPKTFSPQRARSSAGGIIPAIFFASLAMLNSFVISAQRNIRYKNVVSANIGVGVMNTTPNIGGGLEYERLIGPDGLVSVTAGLAGYRAATFFSGGASVNDIDTRLTGFCAAPGFRLNAFRNSQRFYMGFGLSFPFGNQNRTETKISGSNSPSKTISSFYGAAMLQANMNFYRQRQLIGVFLNFGAAYEYPHKIFDRTKNSGFALLIGARFGGQF